MFPTKKITILIAFILYTLFFFNRAYSDERENELWRDIRDKTTDVWTKPYALYNYNYFVADSSDTLYGNFGRFLSIRPSENGARFKSNTYLLSRMTLFMEATGALKTLTDSITIFITNSNSDTVWNSPTRLVWGPFSIAGEDCTASTIGTTASQGAVQLNLSPNSGVANIQNSLNSRLASYPHKWLHILGNSYGQHAAAGAGLDTVAGSAGVKVLFRDINFIPPVIYKCASEADSLIYLQVKPNLFNDSAQPDSINKLTVRIEGYLLDIK